MPVTKTQSAAPAPDFIPASGDATPDFIPAGDQPSTVAPVGFGEASGNHAEQPPLNERIQHGFDNLTKIEPANTRPGVMGHIETGLGNVGGGAMSIAAPLFHPIQTGKAVVNTLAAGPTGNGEKIFKDNPSIGEGILNSARADLPGTLENVLGSVMAGGLAGEAAGPLVDRLHIPTKGHAASVFADIERQGANQPVYPRATRPALDEFNNTYLAHGGNGGHGNAVISMLDDRTSNLAPPAAEPLPMGHDSPFNLPEARDFYTNVSREAQRPGFLARAFEPPSAADFRRNVGPVRQGLNSDITDAADSMGRGDDYRGAQAEYRRAAMLNRGLKVGGTIAAGEALRRSGLAGKILGGAMSAVK